MSEEGHTITRSIAIGRELGFKHKDDLENGKKSAEQAIDSLMSELTKSKKLARNAETDLSGELKGLFPCFGNRGPWDSGECGPRDSPRDESTGGSENRPADDTHPKIGAEFLRGFMLANPYLERSVGPATAEKDHRITASSFLMSLRSIMKRNGLLRGDNKKKSTSHIYADLVKFFTESDLIDFTEQEDAWKSALDNPNVTWKDHFAYCAEVAHRALVFTEDEKCADKRRRLEEDLPNTHPIRLAIEEMWRGFPVGAHSTYKRGDRVDDSGCYDETLVEFDETETFEEKTLREVRAEKEDDDEE
ncbi:hypothetical protein THAOC_24347 [Thalassiosira oceanica]|uniref:Uncharacterized protein n=1 Tax=Thalassiosira oceanica TaxID=159749 RepID=K0S4L0_THAOC|nr:hypothetical protein THAOC_24347 [Thalassiosira oceanica]|eukprot:EJK55866.1 hypothetical protein THAOC_24347 [Thalassiosira oceanica]